MAMSILETERRAGKVESDQTQNGRSHFCSHATAHSPNQWSSTDGPLMRAHP